jgi:AbrB family transcriptional regulator (stage V sporulation protein T)
VQNKADGGQIISIYDGDDFPYENQIIVPIISRGDCLGSVIIFDDDKFNKLSQEHLRLVELGSTFLSKQFE